MNLSELLPEGLACNDLNECTEIVYVTRGKHSDEEYELLFPWCRDCARKYHHPMTTQEVLEALIEGVEWWQPEEPFVCSPWRAPARDPNKEERG